MDLPITNIINVNVESAPVGLGNFNVNNLAFITSDQFLVNTSGDLYRQYSSLSQVGTDFGTNTETYAQAAAVFSQNPSIQAGGGNLIIFPAFTATAIASVSVSAGGSGYKLGDILTIIESGATAGTVTVTGVNGSGTISSVSLTTGGAGYSATVSLATMGGAGTGATITVLTLTTETLLQAIQRVQSLIFFVGIISTSYGANTTWKVLADAVQGYQNKLLFLPSNSQPDIQGVFTTIATAADNNTRCLFYSDANALNARLFAAAYASRLLSVDFTGSNTALTMNLQTLQTISPDAGMTQNLKGICQTAGVDIYVSTAGDPGVYSFALNKFADEVYNTIWFVAQLEVNGYNALKQVGTKVPQTEPGMSLLKQAYAAACQQGVTNGFIAPGKWTSAEFFGNQADLIANILQKGFYIYSQPVNQQNTADRVARKAPLCQIAIKEAGAIQTSIVNVFVNQ